MKVKGFTLVEAIITIVILAIIAAVLFPFFARSRESHSGRTPQSVCLSNLKQIGLGFRQYIQDYDEKFPPSSANWVTVYLPYIKSTQIFQCPAETKPPTAVGSTTDYYFNARLMGIDEFKTPLSPYTIAAGDGMGEQPPNTMLSRLPVAWRNDSNSPTYRHLNGANYLFADGHVKALKPAQITLNPPPKQQPTFLVK